MSWVPPWTIQDLRTEFELRTENMFYQQYLPQDYVERHGLFPNSKPYSCGHYAELRDEAISRLLHVRMVVRCGHPTYL